MLPSAAELVARYLRSNGYNETLSNFILETGLPPEIGSNTNDAVTIESILQEKKIFDTSLSIEKLGLGDDTHGWSAHAPSKPIVLSSLPSRSNILSVSVFDLSLDSFEQARKYVAITTADRKLHLLDPTSSSYDVAHTFSSFFDSPILDILVIDKQHILVGLMSGKLILYDTVNNHMLDVRKDHSKYVVKVASHLEGSILWVASAGWDTKVVLYKIELLCDHRHLGAPTAVLTLPSIPETVLFIESPDGGAPILVVARRDSTFLHFYATPSSDSPAMELLGKQNLAPHSNAWVAFTPSDVQICPTDRSLVAVATSTTPHMRLLILRLLVPSKQSSLLNAHPVLGPDGTVTQASQAHAELLIQDREEAAILVNVSTLAPQTQYSTPRLVWRPDGSGVYVSSDDGIVRGIEATTGKLMTTLEAHDPGSKLRCLWAGRLDIFQGNSPVDDSPQECLISGGFDQKLVLWRI